MSWLRRFSIASLPRLGRRGRDRVTRPVRGQSMLELTVMLPLMLLLVFGAIDFGRVFFDYIGLRNAAMEGAIYGSRNPRLTGDITGRVAEHFAPNPLPAGALVTAIPDAACSTIGATGYVTVRVTREFRPISLELLRFLAPEPGWIIPVTAEAKARCMT